MKKILIVGDYSSPTGFAQVLENLTKCLCDKFEITVLACNYNCSLPIKTFDGKVKVYVARSNYGLREILPLMQVIKPDIVFTLNDGYYMPQYYAAMQSILDKVYWISYVVFDGAPLDASWAHYLKFIDKVITPTLWQKDLIEESGFLPTGSVDVIPHGFDAEVFFALSDEEVLKHRKQILSSIPNTTDDTFIMGMIAKNFNRKRWPEAIQSFAYFCENVTKDAVFLCYTTNGFSIDEFNLRMIAETYGVKDKVVILSDITPLTDEKMNSLYNVMDLNLLLSIGEGFGLPTLYASAVGRHTIVYDNSVQRELSQYVFGSIVADANSEKIIFPNDNNNIRNLPNIASIGKHMKDIYNRRIEIRSYEYRESMSLKQYNMAWKNISPYFESIFNCVKENKTMAVI